MLSFMVIVVLILMMFIYINKKTGKIFVILPANVEDEEDLINLPNERAYYDETNKAIIDLKKKIDKDGIKKDDIEEINSLKESILKGFKNWEEVQLTLEKMIEERTSFVTQGNFYPKEYVYDINRMRTQKEKARDYQLNNPMKSLDKARAFIQEQNDKVKLYKEVKEKTEVMLSKLEIYEKSLKTKKDKVLYFEKKQQLFLHLQNGELDKAKGVLKDLKSRVKHIK